MSRDPAHGGSHRAGARMLRHGPRFSLPVRSPREQTEWGTLRGVDGWPAGHAARTLGGHRVVFRHPTPRGTRRGAHRHAVRGLGTAAACFVVAAGGLAISGAIGIGVAPAADTVLNCTDIWTGGAGTTD